MFGKLKRLNGWQRIGVVASVVWALYGLYLVDYSYEEAKEAAKGEYRDCIQLADPSSGAARPSKGMKLSDIQHCVDAEGARNDAARDDAYGEFIEISVLPIPLGWLAVYGLVVLFRWIRAGFSAKNGP
ncbi:MAG: hypothetical protein WCA10_05335 [Terracidiphilus sp.]